MAIPHGKNTKVLIDTLDVSTYFRGSTMGVSQDTAETTTYQATGGGKTFVLGQNESTTNLDGLYDGAASAIDSVLAALVNASTPSIVVVGPNGLTNGEHCHMTQAFLTAYEIDSPVSDVVSVTAEFVGTSPSKMGPSLISTATSFASAATTNSVGVISPSTMTSTTSGLSAFLCVVTNGRNGTLDVKLQDSADTTTGSDGTWADITSAAFTQVGAATLSAQVIRTTGTVRKGVRAVTTVAGSSGTINLFCGYIRH